MSFVAVAIVGGAAIGAIATSEASRQSSRAMTRASNRANDTQMAIYEQQRADQEPWRQAGTRALSEIEANKFMDNWQQDPGYEFRMSQGMKAINAAAGARGGVNGGATLKALTRYGQDYASQEYGNAYNRQFNRLSQLAGFGQGANAANANAGANYANAYSNNVMGAANASAAANMAQSNAINNLIGTGINTYGQYQIAQQFANKPNVNTTYSMGNMAQGMPVSGGTGYLGFNRSFY